MQHFDLKNILDTGKLEDFFTRKKTVSVGIDIGTGSIKIVQLEKKKEGIVLENYALIEIKKEGQLVGNERYQAISKVIKKVLDDLDWEIDSANVSIPANSSLITAVDFQGSSIEEINQRIKLEISRYIPIPLEEVIYGWDIVSKEANNVSENLIGEKNQVDEKEKEKKDENRKAIIVAVMKEISRKYEQAVSASEIAVEVLEVDVFSLARCLGKSGESSFLVDLGENSATLVTVLDQKPIVVKSLDLGSSKITELIAHYLKVDIYRADKLKKEEGLTIKSEEIKSGIESLLRSLKEEITLMKQVFNQDFPSRPIEKIILSGGGAKMVGLKDFLVKELGMQVELGLAFEKLVLPEKIKNRLMKLEQQFSVAVGLALLGLEEE